MIDLLQLFLTHLQGYKRQAVWSPILIVVEVICELLLPLVMAEIVDTAIPAGDETYIFQLGAVMLVLAGVAMLCGVLAAKYSAFASQGFGANLRQCLFDKVQEFSFADIDRFSSASLITRMTNDVNAMTMMLAMGLRMLVRAPVMLVAALAVSISINARLAMVMLVAIPLLVIAIGVLMSMCNHLFQVLQTRIDALNGTVQENLVGIRVVKAFVRAGYEKTKFKKSNDDLTKAAINVDMRVIAMMPIMMIALNGATAAVLYLGGSTVMSGGMLIGDLSSFITYIFQILMSVMMLGMSLLQLSRAIACARRIDEVLETEPSIEDGSCGADTLPAPKGQVEFRHVDFKYQAGGTGENVLTDIDFTVRPGEFLAVVGGTGTGKSSLVNLIPRFYDVTDGAVLVDGVDVRDYPLDELRARIGMVLQNNVLFTGTIRENLLWGRPDATEEEMIQAAKNAQAYDFVMALPDGYHTMVGEGGSTLSGGEKQRVSIARAILKDAPIVILDEATSSVDPESEHLLLAAIRELTAGKTLISIAHRLSTVRDADQIVVVDQGRIVQQGTHDALMAQHGLYRRFVQVREQAEGWRLE